MASKGNVAGPKGATATAKELVGYASNPVRPLRFKPRSYLTPLGVSIQHALFRVDRDGRTRLEKLGERLVRDAVAGDNEAAKIVADRFVGKVMPQDDKGADQPDLGSAILASLVDVLVDKKLAGPTLVGSATVTDVVEKVTRDKLKE